MHVFIAKLAYFQGRYRPRHPEKYVGDPNNIIFRSSWELIVCKFFDMNPNVLNWGSEEFSIQYIKPTDGRVHRYFPDFIVKVRNKQGQIETWVVEVKPHNQSVPPKDSSRKKRSTLLEQQTTFLVNQAKWKAIKEYCAKSGWKFKVLTEHELGLK